jgi:hypothetical protein
MKTVAPDKLTHPHTPGGEFFNFDDFAFGKTPTDRT